MAEKTPKPSTSTRPTSPEYVTGIFRYKCHVLKIGTKVLRKVFDSIVDNDFGQYLATKPSANAKLTVLVESNAIPKSQHQFLPPIKTKPTSADFDMNLLLFLLREVCIMDNRSVEALISKLKKCMDDIMDKKHFIHTPFFRDRWYQSTEILHALNTHLGKDVVEVLPLFEDTDLHVDIDVILVDQIKKTIREWEMYRHIDIGPYEQWKKCIDDGSIESVKKLLLENTLPPPSILNKSCSKFGRKSDVVKIMCDAISEHIESLPGEIMDVWPAYRYTHSEENDENKIVFVVITKDLKELKCEYSTCIRCNGECSPESTKIVKEQQGSKEISKDELPKLTNIVNKHSKTLLSKHSNITMISVSWMKSKGFGTPHGSIEQLQCIALYVHIKGMIPIAEEPFQEKIENIPIDVREATFTFLKGGPVDYHETLKMGCAIGVKSDNKNHILSGTLGGFVQHQDHGLCCLTSGHALYDSFCELTTDNGVRKFNGNETVDVFQPSKVNSPSFGQLVKVVYKEGEEEEGKPAGVDVALVKIFEREPTTGDFPSSAYFERAGFTEQNRMEFTLGETEKPEGCLDLSVVKYGYKTEVTHGTVFSLENTLRIKYKKKTLRFMKQILVTRDKDIEFADAGDSGALVFLKPDTGDLKALGLLQGTMGDGTYIVTPIIDILQAIGLQGGHKFKQFPTNAGQNEEIRSMVLDQPPNSDPGTSEEKLDVG